MAGVANNFVLLNDDDIAKLLDGADSTNTKKQIKYAVRRLESYARCVGTTLDEVEAYGDAEHVGLHFLIFSLYKILQMTKIYLGVV